ncbi:MAG: hypothetical protein JOZ51_08420 [Chloroflexi bacterium]|nr:hypothetical protein [Chloroflexota bacterium]
MQRRSRYVLMLTLILGLSFFAGTAAADFWGDYNGNGHFATGSLRWCHSGTYGYANLQAISVWNANTDMSVAANCTGNQITTNTANWGNNNLYGKAFICQGSYGCDVAPFNYTFTSCTATTNTYYYDQPVSNDLFRQSNAMHELGHCWSLGHRNEGDSIMMIGFRSQITLNAKDIQLLNNRY